MMSTCPAWKFGSMLVPSMRKFWTMARAPSTSTAVTATPCATSTPSVRDSPPGRLRHQGCAPGGCWRPTGRAGGALAAGGASGPVGGGRRPAAAGSRTTRP